jgi:hypothetical protein
VTENGGAVFTALVAGDYLRGAEHFGRIGFTPEEVADQSPALRRVADISLIRALRLKAVSASPPADKGDCRLLRPPQSADAPAEAPLTRGSALVGAPGAGFATVGLRRFADPGASSYELVRVG